jgi:DNA-binding response OmpR family regulator
LKQLLQLRLEELSSRLPEVAQAQRIKVVVADDDDVVREIVCVPLRKWGFDVLVARDGDEAMQALQKEAGPILAILDWVMPGMNGLDVCRRIRATKQLVYILLLNARSGKEEILEALQAGADDYLVKRISQEELYVRLSLGIRILALESQLAARTPELAGAAN